jgi:hypothetical protein
MRWLSLLCLAILGAGCAPDLDTSVRSCGVVGNGWEVEDGRVEFAGPCKWRLIEAHALEDGRFEVRVGFSVELKNTLSFDLIFNEITFDLLDDSRIVLFSSESDLVFRIKGEDTKLFTDTFSIRVRSMELLSEIDDLGFAVAWSQP